MTNLRIGILLALTVLLSACASQTFAPDQAPEYVTIQRSPFYRTGPMQTTGPDENVDPNVRVKLLRKEMGFSLVQLPDEQTGYIANENMAVAPPRPPEPAPTVSDDSPSPSPRGKRRGGSDSPRYTGEQVNDIPLPNAPPPDLNIAPEEVPAAAPTPRPTPAESPKFRF